MAAKRRRSTPSSPDQTFLFFAEEQQPPSAKPELHSAEPELTQSAETITPVVATTDRETRVRKKLSRELKSTTSETAQPAPHPSPATTKPNDAQRRDDKLVDDKLADDKPRDAENRNDVDILNGPTDASGLIRESRSDDEAQTATPRQRHIPTPHIVPPTSKLKPTADDEPSDAGSLKTRQSEDKNATTRPTNAPDSQLESQQREGTSLLSDNPSLPSRLDGMVDSLNQHLSELSGRDDFSDDALETLGKHDRVTQLVPNEVIRASAGTGKTFQLSNRYLKLLALGQDPRHILATTFTRKAAGEILERIIQRLTAAAIEESAAEQLSSFIDLPVNRDDCRVLLKRMIRYLNGLQIGTLDSFFGQVARTFCFELELPQSWTIVDEQDEARMQNRAIGLAMNDSGVLNLLHLLEKGEATRGLGAQMRWAVEEVYPLFNQTELEAWKIPGAKENLKPPSLENLKSCLPITETTHGERGLKTLQSLVEMAEAQRWDDVLKNTFAKNVRQGNTTYSRKQMPPQLIAQIQHLLQHADDLFINQLQERNTSAYQLMAHFDRHYKSMKTATGDLRFDNVQTRLARWVGNLDDPAKRMVARLDFHIEHLLLDEFQDTVPQQWRILYPIARSIAAPESTENPTSIDHGTLFCVGDQKQAIYRWRGGDSRIFATVKERFESVQERAMNTSYRSSPIVLDAVNRVFQNLQRHPKSDQWMGLVEHWEEMFQAHQASPNNQSLTGYVTLEQTADEDEFVLERAAQRVAQFYEQTNDLSADGISIGVLVPKNQDVAVVMGYLNRLNVPASEESGNPLSDSASIQLLISLLQLIDHPGDSAAWFHFLQSPIAESLLNGFNPTDIRIARQAFPMSDQPIWQRLIVWAQELKSELLIEGLGDTIAKWAKVIGPVGTDRDRKRLKQAVAAAYEYESPAPMRTSELARFLSQLKQIDRTQARVRVMNIHQSKGLEFDIVVLTSLESSMSANIAEAIVSYQPDLSKDPTIVCRYTGSDNWDLLPREHQIMFQTHRRAHFNEKLCQLYVGMTRARRALHMIIEPMKREPTQSLAGVLRTSLSDVEEDTGRILFQSGDPNWHVAEIEKRQAKIASRSNDSVVVEKQWQWIPLAQSERPQRGLQRVSPSSLEGGATFPLASLLSSQQRQSAFLKGEIIHGWFELIDWLDDGVPTEEALRKRATKVDVDSSHWELWIPEFQAMLNCENTRHVLSRSYYLRKLDQPQWGIEQSTSLQQVLLLAQNERPFAILDDGQLLNGFIDRLVTIMDGDRIIGADIVDYKTDRFEDPNDEETIANRVAHYRPQLEAYRIAVSKLTRLPLDAISARLVFVSIDQVRRI